MLRNPPGNDILSSPALLPLRSLLFYLLFLFATTPRLISDPLSTIQHIKSVPATTDLFLFPLICPSLPCALTQIGEGIVCQQEVK